MGKWLAFAALALITALLAPQAQAQCANLRMTMAIAGSNFAEVAARDRAELDQMVREIRAINNDALLALLKSSGQAREFGDLRSFLTQLKLIVQAAENEHFIFTEQMRSDLTRSNQVITAACDAQEASAAAPTEPDNRGLTGPLSATRDWVAERHRALKLQAERLEANKKLSALALILTGLSVAIILVWSARFGMRILRRNRRKGMPCDLPAEIKCMMQTIPIRVTFLSKSRCSFTALAEEDTATIQKISAGTYCTITTLNGDLSAQKAVHTDDDIAVEFRPALSKRGLQALIALSNDLSAVASGPDPGKVGHPVKT